jgi:hypothetical protein
MNSSPLVREVNIVGVGLPANRGQLIRRLVPAEIYLW